MSERTSCNPLLGAGSKSTRSCCAEVQALPSPSPHSSPSPRSTAATAQWAPNPLGDTGPPWCHTLPGHLRERHLLHLPQGCPGNLRLTLSPLLAHPSTKPVTFSPLLLGFSPRRRMPRLHTGSPAIQERAGGWQAGSLEGGGSRTAVLPPPSQKSLQKPREAALEDVTCIISLSRPPSLQPALPAARWQLQRHESLLEAKHAPPATIFSHFASFISQAGMKL